MKNRSIRFRIAFIFTVFMIAISGLVFFLFRMVSVSVLQKNIREYLIGAVELNTQKIKFADKKSTDSDNENIFIKYTDGDKDGYLEIDADFLQEMNDVESALYHKDGEMIYGKNPIAGQISELFDNSRIQKQSVGDSEYYIYDRKLVLDGIDNLWIRGVVPLAKETEEIKDITLISLFFLPVIIAVSFGGGYIISGRMLKPIRRIERSAGEISEGEDLKKRIETGDGEDELSNLIRTFNAMLDRLEDSFERERQFTSDASHELRTPMSVIAAQTEMSLEDDQTTEEYKAALNVIKRQSDRMRTLIEDMLTYTRLDKRAGQYVMEDMNISILTKSICKDMKLIKDKGIVLSYDVDEDIHIKGNPMLISRALQNLISNAYKFGKEDGHIKVKLKYKSLSEGFMDTSDLDDTVSSDTVYLSVADDGIGIDDKDKDKIFDRFYRGDPSRTRGKGQTKGNGLGLSMVKKIVQIHDGSVTLKSKTGIGSEFVIEFESLK